MDHDTTAPRTTVGATSATGQRKHLLRQILSGYIAVVLVFLVVAGFLFAAFQDVAGTTDALEATEKRTDAAQGMRLAFEREASSSRGYALTGASAEREEYAASAAAFDTYRRALSARTPEETQILARADAGVTAYREYTARMLAFLDRGDPAAAHALIATGEGLRHVAQVEAALDELVHVQQQDASAQRSMLHASVALSHRNLIVGSAATIAISGVFGVYIGSRVRRTIATIDASVEALTRSGTEVATMVEQQERTTAEQDAAVTETTTTMGELEASAAQSAVQAEAAARAAEEVLHVARTGTTAVDESLRIMDKTKGTMGAFSDQIQRLSEQVSQVAHVATLVGDIAGQVNMLALNAAVEASRAGENGRGFSVVASEIRKLADQTKREAERIRGIVTEIQKATTTTVLATEEGTRSVDSASEQTRRTAEAFEVVARAIGETTERVQQISLNVKQQSEAISQVLEAMTSLSQGSRETADGMRQTRAALDAQNATVHRLAVS